MWTDSNTKPEDVSAVIKENMGDSVLVGPTLIDQFEKDGRVSYAFRIVFQSFEKTLTNEEVSVFVENIYSALKNKGWEIR